MKTLPRIMTPSRDYTILYPEAAEFAKKQTEIMWPPDEIRVEKDIQDMRVHMTKAEYHGVVTVLRLFTTYELFAGEDYWGGRVPRSFPRPDIRRMASAFQNTELNVHAPFYDKINKLLGLSTSEFYLSYVDDPVLKDRMEFIDEYVEHDDILTSLAVFSMIEGVVLYSSFAFLKHFQNEGKNKIANINAGISSSAVDENLHAEGTAWLFRTTLSEMELDGRSIGPLHKRIYKAAKEVYVHECRIIDMIFEQGNIRGITPKQLQNFVQSRINLCLKNLGLDPLYEVSYNPIGSWFYASITGDKFHDFFNHAGSEYHRSWNEKGLSWVK